MEKRPYGSGRIYRRHRIWWIAYLSQGRELRKSSRSSDRRVAEAMLNKLVGNPILGIVVTDKQPNRYGHGTWRLTVPELRALRGPIVYILTSGERVLYVGCSKHGLCRPLASRHHILAAFDFTGPEELTVHSCATIREAEALERRLIATLQPQLNRATRQQQKLVGLVEEAGDEHQGSASSDSDCPDSVDTPPQDV